MLNDTAIYRRPIVRGLLLSLGYMLATERDNYCISLLSIDGQGIRQALVDEFLRKQIAAQAMCTIVKCKRVDVLEKDVKLWWITSVLHNW